jgi:hypothetical protein
MFLAVGLEQMPHTAVLPGKPVAGGDALGRELVGDPGQAPALTAQVLDACCRDVRIIGPEEHGRGMRRRQWRVLWRDRCAAVAWWHAALLHGPHLGRQGFHGACDTLHGALHVAQQGNEGVGRDGARLSRGWSLRLLRGCLGEVASLGEFVSLEEVACIEVQTAGADRPLKCRAGTATEARRSRDTVALGPRF